jgi:acetoin utilization protein AcuC
MKSKVALIYSEELSQYDLGPEHPLKPIRFKVAAELIKAYNLLNSPTTKLLSPKQATDEEIGLVHQKDYIEMVKKAGQSLFNVSFLRFGLGTGDNPIFPEMHEAASLLVGGSIRAAKLIMEGEVNHAFNIAGGLHHALPAKASGFCIYNDAAVAIAYLIKTYRARVMYIDIDAHHGDGVQSIFYKNPEVLTISLHESGRYLFPGTGFIDEIGEEEGKGFSVNVPFEPYTSDEVYLFAFEELIPPLAQAFKPDIIVSQNGCDAHYSDPLTHLGLTLKGYKKLVSRIHRLAHEVAEGKLLALGGGGYQTFQIVPRAFTLLFADLTHTEIPDEIPNSWREICKSYTSEPLPRYLLKNEKSPFGSEQRELMEKTEELIQRIKEKVFPLHSIKI